MAHSQFTGQDTKQSYLYKIIVVGDAGTSKSSVIERFGRNSYNDEYEATIGVDILYKDLIVDGIDGKKIKLQLWDTAGQERYRSLIRAYYQSAAAYVVTFDITNRETFEHVTEWIKDIRRYNSNSPIFLVGAKLDFVSDEYPQTVELAEVLELARKLSTEEQPIIAKPFVSAKENIGITDLFQSVAKDIYVCQQSAESSEERDSSPISVREESPGSAKSGEEDVVPVSSKPSIWNPWHNTRGKVASGIVAGLCVLLAAAAIPVFWPFLLGAAVSTLIVMGVCALVATSALTYAAGLIAENCCGERPAAGEPEGLLTSSTYSKQFSESGLYDSGIASDVPNPLEDSATHQVIMDEIYNFGSSSGFGLPSAIPHVPPASGGAPRLTRHSDSED